MIRPLSRGSALVLVAAASSFLAPRPAVAQEKAPPSAFGAALAVTRSTGAATVVIFTSRANPASERFREEFDRGAWARYNRGLVQVASVAIEDEPGLARTMGIAKAPAARVYGRTEKGVSLLGSIPDCTTPEALAARLVALQVGLEPPGKDDPAVSQASGHFGVQASQQSQPPAPGWPQVQTPPSPVAPPSLTISAPTASTTTANIVQVPSQNLLIQQAAPQVFVAPTPPPTVYVAQQPTTTTIATAPVANNMFLAVPGAAPAVPSAQAQSQPLIPAQAPAVPAAPATTVGTMTNQSISVPSSSTRTRVRVRGPGLIATGVARLGERMAEFGRTRVEVIQETTLDAPVAQVPGNGTTTISTTSAVPVVPPPTNLAVPIQQTAPPQAAPPSYPTASPQGGHFGRH